MASWQADPQVIKAIVGGPHAERVEAFARHGRALGTLERRDVAGFF